MLYYFLAVLFLLCLGTTISATLASKTSPSDRPPIYRADSFMQLMNLFWLPGIMFFGVLMYLDWKISLIVMIIGLLLGGIVLKPVAEYVIVLPLAKLLIKNK